MIPIAKMLWCLPLPSRTLSDSHALSTWKFRNIRIFWIWFFETKVTFVNASGYCFLVLASLSLPIPPSSFPTTPPPTIPLHLPPPHTTTRTRITSASLSELISCGACRGHVKGWGVRGWETWRPRQYVKQLAWMLTS